MGAKKFCVIGGVAAGMSAASQIKRRSPDSDVMVLERGHDVSYGACGMPYNIADPDREVEDLVVIPAQTFIDKRGIDLRLGHEVKQINREKRVVRGTREDESNFEVGYDVLVLATGSRAKVPDLPGIDVPGVFVLRSLRHAAAIKSWLLSRDCREAIVIGGSYIGLEMADCFRQRGLNVTIVKRSSVMLSFLPDNLDALVREELTRHDVEVIHGTPIQRIEPRERLKLVLADRELETDVILAATGFAPNSELGLAAGLEQGAGGAIAADRFGRTSDPHIYAIGDCSDNFHHLTGKRVWAPQALHANRAGRSVGANALGALEEIPPVLGTSAVKVFGLEVAATGLSHKQAEAEGFSPVSVTIKASTRAHAYPGAKEIHVHMVLNQPDGKILGGAIVGEEKAAIRINVIATALHANMNIKQFAQLDLMYSPPFAPAWDPLLVLANQLVKKAG